MLEPRAGWRLMRDVVALELVKRDVWLHGAHHRAPLAPGPTRAGLYFKRLFALCSLRLAEDQTSGLENRVQLSLTAWLELGQLVGLGDLSEWGLVGYLARLVVGCCALVVLAGSFLLFKFDSIIADMQPALRTLPTGGAYEPPIKLDAHGDILCALRGDIDYGPAFNWAQFLVVVNWMDGLGVAQRAQLGVIFLSVITIAGGALIFYCFPQVFVLFRGRSVRLDSVVCMVDAPGERRRLLAELDQVICDLWSSSDWTRRESLQKMRLAANWRERSLFLKLLASVRDRQLVRPVVLSARWRSDMQLFALLLLKLFAFTSFVGAHLGLIFSYLFELYLQTIERHNQLECQRWHPNGTLFKPTMPPTGPTKGLFLDSAEEAAFRAFSGDSGALLYLMLRFETRHLLSVRVALYYLATTLMIAVLSACSVLWTLIFVVSFYDKIAWLSQIRGQLACCSQQLAGGAQPMELLPKRLIIAYINYELFRRQYAPFRSLTKFLAVQVLAFAACNFYALHLVANRSVIKLQFFSMVISCLVLFTLNLYLAVASYATRQLELLIHDLSNLLAHVTRHQPKLLTGVVVNLWRRQLMDRHEIHSFGSTQILTLNISYRKILALNVQLIATFLLLSRVMSKLQYKSDSNQTGNLSRAPLLPLNSSCLSARLAAE